MRNTWNGLFEPIAKASDNKMEIAAHAAELGITVTELLSYAQEAEADPREITQEDIDNLEEVGGSLEIELGTMGTAMAEYDSKSKSYVVTVYFKNGVTAEYPNMDAGEVLDLEQGKAGYYNANMRIKPFPWPFGDPDFLHYPNQIG